MLNISCKACGREVPADAKFCSGCAAPIQSQDSQQQPQQPPPIRQSAPTTTTLYANSVPPPPAYVFTPPAPPPPAASVSAAKPPRLPNFLMNQKNRIVEENLPPDQETVNKEPGNSSCQHIPYIYSTGIKERDVWKIVNHARHEHWNQIADLLESFLAESKKAYLSNENNDILDKLRQTGSNLVVFNKLARVLVDRVPNFPGGRFQQAYGILKQGRAFDVHDALMTGLTLSPWDPTGWNLFAVWMVLEGRNERALSAISLSIFLFGDYYSRDKKMRYLSNNLPSLQTLIAWHRKKLVQTPRWQLKEGRAPRWQYHFKYTLGPL